MSGILLAIILMTCHKGNTIIYLEGVPSSFSEDLCLPQPFCNGSSSGSILRCECDDLCSVYDECCPDAPSLGKELPFETSVTPDDWSCILPKIICPNHMYMVTSCPNTADSQLSSKCAQEQLPFEDYDFLQDIPVKSSVTGFVYRNIFCARCHTDAQHLENVTIDLVCGPYKSHVKNFGILTKMNYIPGSLKWRGLLTEDIANTYYHNFSYYDIGETIDCDVYHETGGRLCFNVKRKCSEDWPYDETRRRCSSHSYRVVALEVAYKNLYCALCNNIPSEDIACEVNLFGICASEFVSLTDIFKFTGDCEETESWNFLSQECEPLTYSNESFFITRFPNSSVYYNSTRKLCRKGECEMEEEDQIQLHQEQTPAMASVLQLVSTVAICISLVCMILHLFIFLSQQERPSAPSLSHVCMVCSLFLAELVFLLAFGGLKNHHLCVACALLMDFLFTASFLWMSVISFDMCRAFRSRTFQRKGLKTFAIYYGIVAVPSLLKTLAVALLDNLSMQDFFLRPNFGMNRCWYNTPWSLSLFFLGPVFALVATNVLVFIFFVYDFSRQQKVAEFAGATGHRNRKVREGKKPRGTKAKNAQMSSPAEPKEEEADSPPARSEQEKHRLLSTYRTQLGIYTKVALLMGISWVLPLIGAFIQSIVLDYFSVILNALQGAFIFLAFDCNLDKWRNTFRKYQSCLKEYQKTDTNNRTGNSG